MARPRKPIQTIAFVSLGCPKNLVDSERMLGLLAEDGLAITPDAAAGRRDRHQHLRVSRSVQDRIAEGDPRRDPDEEGRQVQAGGRGRLPGAAAQDQAAGRRAGDRPAGRRVRPRAHRRSRPRQGKPAAGARAFPGQVPRPVARTGRAVAQCWRPRQCERQTKTNRLPVFEDDRARLRLTPRHYAYLRISEGCNQGCTFCTIPSIRGPMRSKPIEQILAEAQRTGRRRRGRAEPDRPGHHQLRHRHRLRPRPRPACSRRSTGS